MMLFDFDSISEQSGIEHMKTVSYLENLRVIIGGATKSGHYTKLHHF